MRKGQNLGGGKYKDGSSTTVDQMDQLLQNGPNQRRNVRDNRLLRYEQQAWRDQNFQDHIIVGIDRVFTSLDNIERERKANQYAINCLIKMVALDQPEAGDILADYEGQIALL